MQNWWTVRELARMKQAEILREAERYRMVQKGQPNRLQFREFGCFLLKKLGRLLVNCGSSLQDRYGATRQNPLP